MNKHILNIKMKIYNYFGSLKYLIDNGIININNKPMRFHFFVLRLKFFFRKIRHQM